MYTGILVCFGNSYFSKLIINNNNNNNGIYIALIYIAVLSALQCKKGLKNIIKHISLHIILLYTSLKEKKKNKNKNKYDETKCHIPF